MSENPMIKRGSDVMQALQNIGGEASGFQIHRQLVTDSKFDWRWVLDIGGMYKALYRLEHRGKLISRWGDETPETGGCRPRIYTIVKPD